MWFGDREVRPLWPMLNLLLIGPSGIGKSSAILLSRRLFNALPRTAQPQFVIGASTKERLHDDLFVQPHAVIFASELANFFNRQEYNKALVAYFTELLDYEPVECRTKSGGITRIDEPAVTVVGGSTVEWLQMQLPDAAATGGFLARFMIVNEDHKAQRIANPDTALTKRQKLDIDNARAGVYQEFFHCVETARGNIGFRDFGVSDLYELWYLERKAASGQLAPFAARAPEFVKRLAMLLAVSAHRESIYEGDILAAIRLYQHCEAKLQDVVVPYTPQGRLIKMILDTIGRETLSQTQVIRAMQNTVGAQEVQKHLQGLQLAGSIERTAEGLYRRKES